MSMEIFEKNFLIKNLKRPKKVKGKLKGIFFLPFRISSKLNQKSHLKSGKSEFRNFGKMV